MMISKDFLKIADQTSEQILSLLSLAQEIKQKQKQGIPHYTLQGKVLGMLFEKSSTRTRVSFEVGMLQLGGHALFLSSRDLQLGRGESIHDTAKVLSGYLDGLMIRTHGHSIVEEFAKHASIPVINGLTDLHHPCQVMADLLTILEYKGRLEGLKIAYLGDGNNMAHSLLEAAVKVGIDIVIASPDGYQPDAAIVAQTEQEALLNGSKVEITTDPQEAVNGADIVVTDVWASMGQEEEQADRQEVFKSYQVNADLCRLAKDDYIFLHCLPAHRGEEVTAEIIDGHHSVVFAEANNRLHVQKAILTALLGSAQGFSHDLMKAN